MPSIQKIFTLEVSVEKFLENCSTTELIELDLLLNNPRFQDKMKDNANMSETVIPVSDNINSLPQ